MSHKYFKLKISKILLKSNKTFVVFFFSFFLLFFYICERPHHLSKWKSEIWRTFIMLSSPSLAILNLLLIVAKFNLPANSQSIPFDTFHCPLVLDINISFWDCCKSLLTGISLFILTALPTTINYLNYRRCDFFEMGVKIMWHPLPT